jgi:hypothetical protein
VRPVHQAVKSGRGARYNKTTGVEIVAPRKKFTNPTAAGRSRKAHIASPPRKLAPSIQPKGGVEREVGQFTHEGGPALEKK